MLTTQLANVTAQLVKLASHQEKRNARLRDGAVERMRRMRERRRQEAAELVTRNTIDPEEDPVSYALHPSHVTRNDESEILEVVEPQALSLGDVTRNTNPGVTRNTSPTVPPAGSPPMVSPSFPTPLLTTSLAPPPSPPPSSPASAAASEGAQARAHDERELPATRRKPDTPEARALTRCLATIGRAVPESYHDVLRSALRPMQQTRRLAWATSLEQLLAGEGGSGLHPTGDQLGRAIQEAAQNNEFQGRVFLGYVRRVMNADAGQPASGLDDAMAGASVTERWLARFFGSERGTARQEARRSIARLLTGEAVQDNGRAVRAKDSAHLERCAAAMLDPSFTLRNPAAAVTVLLRKLQDPEKDANGRLPGEAQAHAETQSRTREEKYDSARKRAIAKWRMSHVEESTRLDAQFAQGIGPHDFAGRTAAAARAAQEIAQLIEWPDYETWLSAEQLPA
jgi:hypothetical protein